MKDAMIISEKTKTLSIKRLTLAVKLIVSGAMVSAVVLGAGCGSSSASGKNNPTSGGTGSADKLAADAYCSRMSANTFDACGHEVKDDLFIGKGKCINVSDDSERAECLSELDTEINEQEANCQAQLDARMAIYGKIGEARYDPDFTPENFVDPDAIGTTVAVNPYFPLVVGNKWVWEGGEEKVTDTVTDKTKLIEGVKCRVVLDEVEEDGEVIEITDDWYAQDLEGNVWYCGESARDFESFDGDEPKEPELVESDGSWKTGRDGAKPGMIVPFAPQVGQAYRQEILLGDAEDFAEVTSMNGNESVPGATCANDCLVTKESSPIEPGVVEEKHYKPGVGLILEVPPEPGEPRVELTEFSQAAP